MNSIRCPICSEELNPIRVVLDIDPEKVVLREDKKIEVKEHVTDVSRCEDLMCGSCKSTVQHLPHVVWGSRRGSIDLDLVGLLNDKKLKKSYSLNLAELLKNNSSMLRKLSEELEK